MSRIYKNILTSILLCCLIFPTTLGLGCQEKTGDGGPIFPLYAWVDPEGSGTIQIEPVVYPGTSGSSPTTPGTYIGGTVLKLTAVPANNFWEFSGWSGDAEGTGEFLEVCMTESKRIVANFQPVVVRLTATSVPAEGGDVMPTAIEPDNTIEYQVGQPVTLTAEAREGYRFLWWVDIDPGPGFNPDEQALKNRTSESNIYTFTIQSDVHLYAIFVPLTEPEGGPITYDPSMRLEISPTVAMTEDDSGCISNYLTVFYDSTNAVTTLTLKIDGKEIARGIGGAIVANPTITRKVFCYGTVTLELTATSGEGYTANMTKVFDVRPLVTSLKHSIEHARDEKGDHCILTVNRIAYGHTPIVRAILQINDEIWVDEQGISKHDYDPGPYTREVSFNSNYRLKFTAYDSDGNTHTYLQDVKTPPLPSVDRAPAVISTAPADGATYVPVNTSIAVTFSEVMDTQKTTGKHFLANPDFGFTLRWSNANSVAYLEPDAPLQYDTEYTIIVHQDVISARGISMGSAYTWSFRTDKPPPKEIKEVRVTGVFPENGATGVPVDSDIRFTFSEPMDHVSTEAALVISPEIHYEAAWSEDGKCLTLYLVELLKPGTTYEVYLSDEARSMAGAELGMVYGTVFQTGE